MNDTKRRMLAAAIACGFVAAPSLGFSADEDHTELRCSYHPSNSVRQQVVASTSVDESTFNIGATYKFRHQVNKRLPTMEPLFRLSYPRRTLQSATSRFDYLAYLLKPSSAMLSLVFKESPKNNRFSYYVAIIRNRRGDIVGNAVHGNREEHPESGRIELWFEWDDVETLRRDGNHLMVQVYWVNEHPSIETIRESEPAASMEIQFDPSQYTDGLGQNLLPHLAEYKNSGPPYERIEYKGSVSGRHYTCIETTSCFLTTATVEAMGLQDDCWELEQLRNFRDRFALRGEAEAALMKAYYALAPDIVANIDRRADSRKLWCRTWLFGILPASITASLHLDKITERLYVNITRRLQRMAKESVHLSA